MFYRKESKFVGESRHFRKKLTSDLSSLLTVEVVKELSGAPCIC